MGQPDELAWTPAWQLRELMGARLLSPVEYARFLLDRVERYGTRLGAFISVFPDHLLDAARSAEVAIMRGGPLAPLHGLPISVKDILWTKGQRTTLGSKLFADFIPDRDSVAIERIRQAGGIVFAKANLPEFSMNRRTLNLVAREALSPWDARRSSGGSSGGSAVAVAAGLGPVSIGTDNGGSIRIPSAFNGVFGLQPSRGRVPNGAGFYDAPLMRIGPIARDVRDAAMLLQVMAGPDRRDPFSLSGSAPDYSAELEKGVKGVRIAWSADFGRVEPERPEVVDVCHAAARAFLELGAAYAEPRLRLEDPMDALEPDPEYAPAQREAEFRKVLPDYKDLFAWIRELPAEKQGELTIYIRDRSDRPNLLDYTMSIKPEVRQRVKNRLADVFERFDLLLSPTIARPAFIAGEPGITPFQYTAYTLIVNVSGLCAASVPAGLVDGLPVGLQIMGRPGEEALVLRAARALEQARPWAERKPGLV
jgi:Asp-tRNA(Asn)/Glu-tRNA(Gln) amidotransferase A subunit family amidase